MDSQVHYHIDFESASKTDLKLRGLDNYAKCSTTHILMMGYACGDAEPQLWFPHVEPLPAHLELILRRPEIIKHAFNVEFERTMLREVMGIDTPIHAWEDAAVTAKYASIAGNLGFVGDVVGIDEDKKKLAIGKKLIKLFCTPNKAGEFNDWNSHPEEWKLFGIYCLADVSAEREIAKKLRAFALPATEKKAWYLDQEINDRGMPVDLGFVSNASRIVEDERVKLTSELHALTGLENPNSVKQMLGYLKEQAYEFNSLGKAWVTKTLEDVTSPLSEAGRKALELRQQLSKSSTAKLDALHNFVSSDGVLRRQYVFMGAARTARWSGRAVQLQNLPRPSIKDVDGATAAIKAGNAEKVKTFGSPLTVVASCIRSAFRAPSGKHFVVCDLSAIETVVASWLAQCTPMLDVFAKGLDPYVDFGTRLFKLPYERLDPEIKDLDEAESEWRKKKRQMSKPAVLGCFYGLGGGKLEIDRNGDEIKTGLWGYAAGMGTNLTQDESVEMVTVFRAAYPEVPRLWKNLENAALCAVRTGENQRVGPVTFGAVKPKKLLWCQLPSGRRLHYIRPSLDVTEKWDGSDWVKLSYEGNGLNNSWSRTWTWGGKLTENLTQAISRDILLSGMLRAKETGFTIVGHCHDEIIACEDVGGNTLDKLRECMILRPEWGLDIPLNANGFVSDIYKK